jgi:hypothetical protein
MHVERVARYGSPREVDPEIDPTPDEHGACGADAQVREYREHV